MRVGHDYERAYRDANGEIPRVTGGKLPLVVHPLVRIHPQTRQPGLFLSGHAYSIEGLQPDEGRVLIEKLLAFCTREGRVYRHHWREGDVALWDNRCMIHRAQGFDERYARVMHHVRVRGKEAVIAA